MTADVVEQKVGEGTFSRVYRCRCQQSGRLVAIKVILAKTRYKEAAFVELNTLFVLHSVSNEMKRYVVDVLDWFMVGSKHVCVVFPCLGQSLMKDLAAKPYTAMPVDQIRGLAWQALCSVAVMHHQGLIHTDLKPENICYVTDGAESQLASERNGRVQLIDLGSATFQDSHHGQVIATPQYRAPEVLLGRLWSHGVDAWALGCIFFELWYGAPLFEAPDDERHLHLIDRLCGPLHARIGSKRPDRDAEETVWRRWARIRRQEAELFELIRGLLVADPGRRLTARQALSLPFFAPFQTELPAFESVLLASKRLPPVRVSTSGMVAVGTVDDAPNM